MKKMAVFVLVLILLSSAVLAQMENIDWDEKTANGIAIPTADVSNGFVEVNVRETTGNPVNGLFEVYTQTKGLIFSEEQSIGAFEEHTFTYPTDLMEPGVFSVFVVNKDMFVGYEVPLAEPVFLPGEKAIPTGEPISPGDDGVLDPTDVPGDIEEDVIYPIGDTGVGVVKINGIIQFAVQDEEGILLILTQEEVEGILAVNWDAWEKENVLKKSLWERFVGWLKSLFGASDLQILTISEDVSDEIKEKGCEVSDKTTTTFICACNAEASSTVRCKTEEDDEIIPCVRKTFPDLIEVTVEGDVCDDDEARLMACLQICIDKNLPSSNDIKDAEERAKKCQDDAEAKCKKRWDFISVSRTPEKVSKSASIRGVSGAWVGTTIPDRPRG
ncbi:hypothetical protein KY306_01260 [Candidatus Woesearchaeota archaeon]|nr:hypothetical protein [Candidatus Woesearchaeota archaeon]